MRLVAWKNAERKLSGCGEIQAARLIPYVVEMSQIMADFQKAPLRRYAFAEVEMISPLRFKSEECAVFVEMAKRGLLCGVGFMHSAGGSAPATLAGTLSLIVAESLFVNILYRLYYGLTKLWFQCNASVLDMQHAMFPFGRPERGLLTLAMGQIARHFRAGLWASAVYPDAKVPSCEAGLQAAFNMTPAILAGSPGLECFGLLSGAEMGSAVQLVIDNDFAGALKRFARGFDVNEETLAYDAVAECAEQGFFTGCEHTVRHFRAEHWEPRVFSRESLSAWQASGRTVDTDRARAIAADILRDHHPQGISPEVEKDLTRVVTAARTHLV
jgi:trimethylamine--corrinoid protein Co-methyltransferase